MPNWCDNTLTISSVNKDKAVKELEQCLNEIGGEGENEAIDFDKIAPCPKELYDSPKQYSNDPKEKAKIVETQAVMIKKYGYGTAYDFHCEEWGTKWNACDPHDCGINDNEDGASVAIAFQTAWSPPVPIVVKLGQKYPHLRFELKYIEFGCCFAGVFIAEDDYVEDTCVGDNVDDPLFVELAHEFGYGDWLEEMKEEEMDDEIAENEAKEKAEEVAKFVKAMEEVKKMEEEQKLTPPKPTEAEMEQYRQEYGGWVV